MNTGQVFHLISIVSYILSGLTFALTVFLFFRYKIVSAFNVLSGRKLKQDMDRLSHLSGAASEAPGQAPAQTGSLQKKKKKSQKRKDDETDALYGMAATGKFTGQSGAYDTEDWQEGTAADTDELDGAEASRQLYRTEVTDELDVVAADDGTDELDVVVTEASDTELL